MTPGITLDPIDLSIIVLYLLANATIGFVTIKRRKNRTDSEDFLLAGRGLTLPAFVATLVSTWYGGIITVGEYAYTEGIVMWIVFGVPYYVAALLFAFVFSKRVNRDTASSSIADRLRTHYGPTAGYLGAVIVFFMTSPVPYIIGVATLYQWVFGLSYAVAIAVALASSILYLFFGGFRASIRADILQFVVMFLGFAVIIPFAMSKLGGIGWLLSSAPASHLKPFGSFSPWYILVWYIIALSTLVDPNIHLRIAAAKSPRVAKRGLILSVGFWLLFDLMTNVAGLYARTAAPALTDARFAFPGLAELVLPIGLKGLFYTGMLATVLSTVDSFFFTSASIVGRDILWRLWGKSEEETVVRFTRLGLVVTALISIVLISQTDKVYMFWYTMGSILVPGLLFPLTFSYFPRIKPTSATAVRTIICGSGGAIVTYILGMVRGTVNQPNYLWGFEPMYSGLLLAALSILASLRLRSVSQFETSQAEAD